MVVFTQPRVHYVNHSRNYRTLSCSVRPYLWVGQQPPLGPEEEGDAVRGPRHGDPARGEGGEDRVGEEGGEVDDAPGGADAADEAGAHQQPRDQEGPDGLQARRTLRSRYMRTILNFPPEKLKLCNP